MTEQVDRLLREFLEAQAQERAKGVTLEALQRAVTKLADDRLEDRRALAKALADFRDDFRGLEGRVQRVEVRQERHGRRIGALEGQVGGLTEAAPAVENWRPDPREVTGTFQFHQLVAEHQERRSDHKWLKRKGVEWLGAALGAITLVGLSAGVSWVVAHWGK
jgi:hypothetical protein